MGAAGRLAVVLAALIALAAGLVACGDQDPATITVTTTRASTGDATTAGADAGGPTTTANPPIDETTTAQAASSATPPNDPQAATGSGSAAAGSTTPGTTVTNEEPASRPSIHLNLPDGTYGVIWVRRGSRVELRTEPGGGSVVDTVDKRTEFGSPTVFGVVKQVGRWAGVSTPAVPNGQLAWVRLDPRRLNAGWTKRSIVIDLSARRAALRNGHRVVRAFPVTVGAPGVDTPTGRFSVTDTFRGELDPAAYGCCALALSATQPHIPSGWLGGNRIAIHGTTGPLGIAASHGCVRASNADVSALVNKVPLGTPVFIHS
ncbi:MAG: L,D-transpeptidase [Solirubrobacterales bacterium]